MEYTTPSDVVKKLYFDEEARSKIISGVNKLEKAVAGTLGASGLCAIYEDINGKPNVTKDGVTVAESIVLHDPVENIGASLIKQAARNTVREAGDGTTSSIVLAKALLEVLERERDSGIRELKEGLESGLQKVNDYLDLVKIDVDEDMLIEVASISCNNDKKLGKIIGDAFNKVGKDGVVVIENSETAETYADIIDGVQVSSSLKHPYFITNRGRGVSELENPYVLITESKIPNLRRLKIVLEEVTRTGRPLLIIGSIDDQLLKVLMANKVKGNIKVNVIDAPSHGDIRHQILDDLSVITGAKIYNEALGDDVDIITLDMLGSVQKSITDDKKTVLISEGATENLDERIESVKTLIDETDNPYTLKKLEERLGMLSGRVGVIYVGGDSDVEVKEKKDRVDDAVHATKAALKGGIVSGGGVALKDASETLDESILGERVLKEVLKTPLKVVLRNAGYFNKEHFRSIGLITEKVSWLKSLLISLKMFEQKPYEVELGEGMGINAINGEYVNMIENNIIDPVIVTKTALKNAISVVSTIISANSVISNMRVDEQK